MDSSNNTILALDCALRTATVALLREDQVVALQVSAAGAQHSRELLPLLHEVLKMAGITLDQIQSVLYTHGPGGFTSLRVGLATLQGLFWPGRVRFYVVSSLRARCESLRLVCERQGLSASAFVTVMRAGDLSCYAGRLKSAGFDESLMTHAEFLQDWAMAPDMALAGEGLCGLDLAERAKPVLFLQHDLIDAQAFLTLWTQGMVQETPLAAIKLNYLKSAV